MSANNEQIARMPIQEVIKLPGGNGLASPPFQLPMRFLNLFGWKAVESGIEALVLDGQPYFKTALTADLRRLLGVAKFARRVILHPAPLEDISAKALTRDQWELTLVVTINYTISDPGRAAREQDPLAIIRNLIMGVTAEYIRGESFETHISDDGKTRDDLRAALNDSRSVREWIEVIEVLKALPQGDERLIETLRKTKLASSESSLVEQQGKNTVLAAGFDVQARALNEQLEEQKKQAAHQRELELKQMQLKGGLASDALKALGDIAKSGASLDAVSGLFRDILSSGTISGDPNAAKGGSSSLPLPPKQIGAGGLPPTLEAERSAFGSVAGPAGVQHFDVFHAEGRITGALVKLAAAEILFQCGPDYPNKAPAVQVRYANGSTFQPPLMWIPGVSTLMAQAVMAIVPLIRPPDAGAIKGAGGAGADKAGGVFDFDFDDLDDSQKP